MSAQQKKHPFDFKTQYGLGFNPQDDEIVVDFFCGGVSRTKLALSSSGLSFHATSQLPCSAVFGSVVRFGSRQTVSAKIKQAD